MISEDSETTAGKDEENLVPAFGVSGQFMMTSEERAVHTEDFNPRKIVALTLDDSLARLFECLTLEYSGSSLLTPKWKNFRSQKLKFAEKTRINNAIWRSWHIQFQLGQRPLFCQFENPLTEMAKPPKPVTLMVEGRYWKRKLEVVAAEYKKWRVFYKQMVEDKFQDIELQHQTEEILRLDQEISDNLREREKERKYSIGRHDSKTYQDTRSPVSLVVSQALEVVDSCNLMESMVLSLPDTLFSSLGVDNAKTTDHSYGSFTDTSTMVQPTLDTLQPSLEAMTPVLDDLIEQLEASVKGTELNWDFNSLEKNFDEPMGLIQSSTGHEQFETMDHSGGYSGTYRPVQSLASSASVSSWPVQTSGVASHTVFAGNRIPGRVATSNMTPGTQSGVIGIQTVGGEMPGSFSHIDSTPKMFPGNVTSIMDRRGYSVAPSPLVTTSPISASLPYASTCVGGKPNAATARLRYSSASGSIPRNSSDSQLYSLASADRIPSRSRAQTTVPVEVQAPNLVAHLKSAKSRHPLVEEKVKRARLPRNKSAPGLASLEASAQLKKAPQAGGVRAKRQGRIPRNRSDSSLASLISQSEQSGGRQRRQSESDESSKAHTPPMVANERSTSLGSQQSHMFLGAAGVETMRTDMPSSTPTDPTCVVSPSHSLPVISGGGETSHLVAEVVTHLLSKGVSVQEILGKLTSLAAAGATQVSLPQTSFATNITSPFQVSQGAQQRSSMNASTTVSATPTPVHVTTNDTLNRSTPLRNRRKPPTPRANLRSTRAECTAVTEDNGLRTTDEIIRNVLSQNTILPPNQPEVQLAGPSIPLTTHDPSTIQESTTVGSVTRWGNPGSTAMLNANRGIGDVGSPQTLLTQPVAVQSLTTPMAFPAIFQSTSGEVVLQDSAANKQFLGIGSSSLANSGFPPSMLPTTSPIMTMTVAQVSSSTGTTDTKQEQGTTSSVVPGNYKMDTETPVRSRPLTKTLPKEQYIEHRRMVHVSAEQKRRGNIKMGFDQLIAMVPSLASQGNNKISKAAVLRKSVDYISQVQRESENMEQERERLKKQIEVLNGEISVCQQQLPATGVTVNRQDFDEMELLFNRYVKQRTDQNPTFWIYSVIIRPLFDAYCSTVSTTGSDEFYRAVSTWLNHSCSLPNLRPSVLTSLRELIKQTSILTDPSKLPEQARLAANTLLHETATRGRPR